MPDVYRVVLSSEYKGYITLDIYRNGGLWLRQQCKEFKEVKNQLEYYWDFLTVHHPVEGKAKEITN